MKLSSDSGFIWLWWLISWVNLTGLRMPRRLVKHSHRHTQETFAVESVNWVKKIPLTSRGGHHPVHRGPDQNKKGEATANSCFLVLSWRVVFSRPQTAQLLVLGPLDSRTYTSSLPVLRTSASGWIKHWFSWFSSFADGRSEASRPVLVTNLLIHVDKYISISVSYWVRFSEGPWYTDQDCALIYQTLLELSLIISTK